MPMTCHLKKAASCSKTYQLDRATEFRPPLRLPSLPPRIGHWQGLKASEAILEEKSVMPTWTTRCDIGSMPGHRIPRMWGGTFRRTSLILLACMFWVAPMAQAQNSLEELQKRKSIAEAEKAAIEAENARDEARKKQSELVAPLDPPQKTNEAAVEAAKSLCSQCLAVAREELKKCLDEAISQEDKKTCQEKQETRTKTCADGECKIEKTLRAVPP